MVNKILLEQLYLPDWTTEKKHKNVLPVNVIDENKALLITPRAYAENTIYQRK